LVKVRTFSASIVISAVISLEIGQFSLAVLVASSNCSACIWDQILIEGDFGTVKSRIFCSMKYGGFGSMLSRPGRSFEIN